MLQNKLEYTYREAKQMPYEPGSTECLSLISAKDNILVIINLLNKMEETKEIQDKLKDIYKDLDYLHERRKKIEDEL